MPKTITTLLTIAALAALPAAAQAFERQGTSPYEASSWTVDPGSIPGRATVAWKVQTYVPPNESARYTVQVCGNGFFGGPADEDGLPTCTGFANSESVDRPGEFNGQVTIEHILPAGNYIARGIVEDRGGKRVSEIGTFEIVDECRWVVTAAAGIKEGSLYSARQGDHLTCGAGGDFEQGPPAPLVQVLGLRSSVDGTTVRFEGPGLGTVTPISIGGSTRQMALSLQDEGELRLNTPRRLAKQWDTSTESATITQQSGRKTAYNVETLQGGRETVVRNRAGVNNVTTLGHGGAGSIPVGFLDRASCIKLRKWTVTLRRRQSTTVRKGRPPAGGPAQARRACRR